MRRRFGEWPLSCILFFALLPACTILHNTTQKTVVRELSRIDGADNVWHVDCTETEGSGFPISCEPTDAGDWRVIFLTAGHVAYDYDDTYIVNHHDGRELVGSLLDEHPGEDVAALEFFTDDPVAVRYLSFVPVEFGEKVVLSGYPATKGPFVALGVASIEGYGSYSSFPGTSGGPVAREDGFVVGVDVAVFVTPSHGMVFHMSWYVPITRIEKWLAEL